MKGDYKQARDPFFTWSNSDRKRKNGFKLKEVKFKILGRNSSLGVVKHWSRFYHSMKISTRK